MGCGKLPLTSSNVQIFFKKLWSSVNAYILFLEIFITSRIGFFFLAFFENYTFEFVIKGSMEATGFGKPRCINDGKVKTFDLLILLWIFSTFVDNYPAEFGSKSLTEATGCWKPACITGYALKFSCLWENCIISKKIYSYLFVREQVKFWMQPKFWNFSITHLIAHQLYIIWKIQFGSCSFIGPLVVACIEKKKQYNIDWGILIVFINWLIDEK